GPACSSVAQWQSIRLLTGGLLVRVQPEEPLFRSDRDKIGTIWRTNVTASVARCQPQRSALIFPTHLQPSAQFFVGDVQVALRLLNARVPEHQLDDADVDAVRQQPTSAFVPQVVPSEIDAPQLLRVPLHALLSRLRCDAVRQQF